MKKIVCFIGVVALIVVACDLTFGAFSKYYVKNHPLPGDYRSIDYIIKESKDEVVILGSSVALNSFMPSLAEDSLGVSCYNAGANGQVLPFFKSVLECMLSRYTPKLVILGMRPDELSGTGIGGRYNILVPYYKMGYETIDRYMESKDKYEPWLLKSNLYRYNTIWWRILLYHFITPGEPGEKGFVAKGIPMYFPEMTTTKAAQNCSEERLNELQSMITLCESKGVKMVVYFPPMYTKIEGVSTSVERVKEICAKHHFPCFDDSQDSTFLAHKEWFYDNVHLNKDGAPVYTKSLVKRLKAYEENNE